MISLFVGFWAISLPVISALPSVSQKAHTSSGTVEGHFSSWQPEVTEYLGVPYAKAPVGSLRWAAPQPYEANGSFVASKYGASCPANVRRPQAQDSNTTSAGLLEILGQVGDKFSEDCLSLNVWTKPQSGEKAKAVMIWIYGGGFNTGNSASPTYNGARLANDNDVVVVSMNYRLNIFGFPGATFFPDKNLGLLDQRLAVEWVRDNIAAFHGDPKRIILFGESAGGVSVDDYTYAWTKDPIVNGFITESGQAQTRASVAGITKSWYDASQRAGCGGSTEGDKTLACMRTKTMQEILDAIRPPGQLLALSSGSFAPVADGKVVFADYAARGGTGNFIKKPMLIGNNDNEAGIGVGLAPAGGAMPANTSTAATISWTCHTQAAAEARHAALLPVWRYRYAGEWNNQFIGEGAGAYHGSEIALVFGTTGLLSKKPDVPEETKLMKAMMTAWSTFAKDPESGLTKLGWPVYDPEKPTLVRLGGKFDGNIAFVENAQYDKDCARLWSGSNSIVRRKL